MSGIEVKDSPLPASPLYSLPLIFKCDLSAGKRAHARPQERERDGSEFSTSADDAPQLIFLIVLRCRLECVVAAICSGNSISERVLPLPLWIRCVPEKPGGGVVEQTCGRCNVYYA